MTGYVYFIKPRDLSGPIKVGHSVSPPVRMAQIEVWSPFVLEIIGAIPGDLRIEGGLHALFREHHAHGEWFHPAPTVLSVINAILSGEFDFSTLPAPADLRSKAGHRDRGMGALASVLTRAVNRHRELGGAIPAEVVEAAERFSGPIYERRVQGRSLADARVVVAFLERVGKKTPAITAMLTKLEAV